MDPTSLLSLISFAGQTTDLIAGTLTALYQAPLEILSLHNEISDLRVVLIEYHAVHSSLKRPTHLKVGSEDFDTTLEKCLVRIQSLFDELADLTSSLFIERPDGRRRFQRIVWLRKKGSTTQLRLELATVRQNLRDLIGIATVSSITKIELRLNSLGNIHSSIDDTGPRTTPSDVIEHIIDVSAQVPSDDPFAGRLVDAERIKSGRGASPSTLVIESFKRPSCNIQCACSCHFRYRARNPPFVDTLLGVLFIGYTGMPTLDSKCDFNFCRNSSVRAVRITYTFPSWFLRRTVDMVLGSNYFGEPEFNVRIRNRVEYMSEHSIFQLSRQGRVQEMKTLFEKGHASPSDISLRGGRTAFDWAIQRAASIGDLEPCKLLVAAGLDLDLEDDFGRSSAQIASELVLVHRNPAVSAGLGALLSQIDIPELLNFSHLHKVVLEILPLDLSIELKKVSHRSHINATDNLLRTPLSWAAIRGNFDAVQTLLLAGADPHTTDIEGYSALHLAVISGNLRCLDLLLIARAQVHAKAKGGDNCVSIASWATDSPEMIEMLVTAGADFMNRNKGGVTPLQSSACLNFPGNAKALLNLGADVNAFDNNGDTPFFETMYYGCMEVMDILLKQNVDHSHRNKAGLSALHVLALYGNVDIFNRVSSSLAIIDTRLRDSKGRTAIEALEDRPLLEEEFHLAFQNYWEELELTADEQSEDSFASALETQPPTEMSEIV